MDSVSLLPRPSEITAEWLTERLQLNGYLKQGEVTSVQVKPHSNVHYRETSFLSVTYSPNAQAVAPEQMVYKRNNKGDGEGAREGVFYRELVPQMNNPAVPVCLDTDVGEAGGYVLLADMSVTHEQGHSALMTPEVLGKSIDTLADIQGFWWDHQKIYDNAFLELMNDFFEVALMPKVADVRLQCESLLNVGLPQFITQEGDGFPKAWREVCEAVVMQWPDLLAARTKDDQNLTLIHGDFTPGNQLVPFDIKKDRLLIYDWEVSTRGIGVYDLAYLFKMVIPEDEMGEQMVRDLIIRYHKGLLRAGVAHYSLGDCLADYQLAIVANLFYPIEKKRLSSLAKGICLFEALHCEELFSGGSI